MDEAWSHAKEFIDSYEADVKHWSHNTFVTENTLGPLQPMAATGQEGPAANVTVMDTCTPRQTPSAYLNAAEKTINEDVE